ncbi:MAG: hypothetical protein KAS93_02575 [Gammaproteobacteria bacterium]|nr:hypothetical protein [Gammaproteobacteria bacterium]
MADNWELCWILKRFYVVVIKLVRIIFSISSSNDELRMVSELLTELQAQLLLLMKSGGVNFDGFNLVIVKLQKVVVGSECLSEGIIKSILDFVIELWLQQRSFLSGDVGVLKLYGSLTALVSRITRELRDEY